MFKIIAAIGKNRELGKDNQLIFHLKRDMEFFKETTIFHPIVMGVKTFESIGKPLEDRENFVITHNPSTLPEFVIPIEDVDQFINAHKDTNEEIFVIGGAKVYELFLPYAQSLYLTEINKDAEADVFFPEFDKSDYDMQVLDRGVEDNLQFYIMKYIKKDL